MNLLKDPLAPMEQTITLKRPTRIGISAGTPLEATVYFFDQKMGRVEYKHCWLVRVWYTSSVGRRFWKASA